MDEFTAGSLSTGARLIRERPLLVLLWTVVLMAQTVVFAAAAQEIRAGAQGAFLAGRFPSSVTGQLLSLNLVRLIVSLVIAALMWSSAYRAVLRPADRRLVGLGPEELSVFGAWVVTQLVVGVVSAALQFVIIGQFAPMDVMLAVGAMMNAAAVVGAAGLFWSAVASVWAFERRQIAPIRCWTIAGDRFWLLAALVLGVAILEHLAGAGVSRLTAAPPGSNPLGVTAPHADPFGVPALLQQGLTAVLGALEIAFIAGIVATAYRASRPVDQAAAFV